MITLDDITLPDDLWWEDETDWSPVEQTTDYTLSGALLVEEAAKQAGRPLTLAGTETRAWVQRSTVLELLALAAVPGKEMTLVLHERTFTVMFRRGDGPPVAAAALVRWDLPIDTDYYTLTLRLMEI